MELIHTNICRHKSREVSLLFNRRYPRRYTVTMTNEMADRLEEERKRRFLDSIPETIRMILSEYLSSSLTATNET